MMLFSWDHKKTKMNLRLKRLFVAIQVNQLSNQMVQKRKWLKGTYLL